jgi:hypothetical protein
MQIRDHSPTPLPCLMYAVSSADTKRASMLHDSNMPYHRPRLHHHHVHVSCHRLGFLLLLCALDLRCASQLLLTVLSLLAYCRCVSTCLPSTCGVIATYAAVCWASRSCWRGCSEPACSAARTSSTPLVSRRPAGYLVSCLSISYFLMSHDRTNAKPVVFPPPN